jgi:hypothetical protein
MGNRAIEANPDTEPAGRSEAFRFRATATGIARSVALFVDSANAATTVSVAIYRSVADHPSALLSSGYRRNPVAGMWNHIGVSQARLRRGQTYWLAVLGLGAAAAYRDARAGSCPTEESGQTGLRRFPSTWRVGPRWRSCPISAVVSSASAPPVNPGKPGRPGRPGGTLKPVVPPPDAGGRNCIARPSACGYPDQTNTGVPAGTRLTPQTGEITVTTPGTTISGVALDGSIRINANNTTVKNSEIVVNGSQRGCSNPCGGHAILIGPGVTGTVIQDVTCHGGAPTGDNVTEFCVQSSDSSTVVKRVRCYNTTSCFFGPGNWSDSFLDQTGAMIPGEHYENLYYGGGDPSLVVNHNTMLNPQSQTAVVFVKNDFGDINKVTITNNLMAGGGYMIYGGLGGSGGTVRGPVTVTGNRFSRLYYPNGGYYGTAAYFSDPVTTWTSNIWDDTLAVAPY